MTVQPPPRETTAQRRRRLLTDARRLTNDIDAALSEYGDNTQEENRRRADAEIERSFPGVTEDEQNPTGMYMPDPKYYPRGENIRADSNYSETHQPMRRRLTKNVQGTTDFTSNDFTLGGEVAPWSYKEEMDYLEAARRAANTNIVGTGEWAESLTPDKIEEHSGYAPFEYNQAGWTSDEVENALDRGHEAPLSDQELWVRGELSSRRSASRYEVPTTRDVREGRDDRIQLFRGDMVADVEKSQNAPHEIDLRNVRDWAEKHRKEVSETGIEDTEWKERFAKLKEDVVNTVVPINPQEVNSESRHILAKARVENKTQQHLRNLDLTWNNAVNVISSSGPRQQGRHTRRTDGPRRRNIEGVAQSFVNRDDVIRGAATHRGSMTHFGDHSAVGNVGWLDTSRLAPWHQPDISDQNVVYSYDTPIAWRQNDGTVVVPTQRHSKTTNRHQAAVTRALLDDGYHSPQQIADNMLRAAYQLDRHKQTAGSPVGFKHYFPEHGAHEFVTSRETAQQVGAAIADAHYETVRQRQRENAAASARRPRNSRKPFTRRQQLRLEDAGQLRLPFPGEMPDGNLVWDNGTLRRETYSDRNRKIMQYPITLGYSPQVHEQTERRVNELLRQEEEIERRIYGE